MDGWYSVNIDGTTIAVQLAPDDTLFTESPTWVAFTEEVRDLSIQSSGRVSEIDQSQPGMMGVQVSNRDRLVDLAYGPASVAFDGSGSDYWSAGDLAAFSGATQLDVRAAVSLDDWTPSTSQTISAQQDTGTNQRSWQFYIDTSGFLALRTSSNGTASTTTTSGYRVSAVNGQTMCVRATWQSTGAVYFYVKRPVKGRERAACMSHDGWAQQGAVGAGVAAALFNSTAAVTVGDRVASSEALDGSILYADARTTIDSDTLRFAFWPADAASSSATSWVATAGAGETWTKVGSSTITVQGEYYNRIGPGTPMRVVATRSAVDYVIGYSYLRRAPQAFPAMGLDSTVQLTGVDTLGWLAEQQAPSTPSQFGTGTVGHYWPLHEDNNVQQAGDAIGGLPGSWSQPRTAGGPTQPGAVTLATQALIEGTYLTTSEPDSSIDWSGGVQLKFSFYLPAENSIFRVLCSNGTNTTGVNYGVGGEYYTMGNGGSVAGLFDNRLTPGMHTFEMYSNAGSGGSVTAFFDGAIPVDGGGTRAAVSAPNALYIDGSAAAVSDVALFQETTDVADAYLGASGGAGQTSAARMSSLLYGAMGNAPALWDITTDVSTYLGPTALGVSYGELCRQVNTAEQGRFHQDLDGTLIFRSRLWGMTATAATVSQATFGDGAGEVEYVDISVDPGGREDVINDVTVTLPNGASGHYVDTESVAQFGRRTGSYSAPLASPADATGLARHIVGLRAWPQVRITNLVINPVASDAAWTQVLTRKVGDRITVKRRTTDTLRPSVATQPISADVCIERIDHRITRSGEWRTTYLTTPAPPTAAEAGYFTFDDTVLGQFDAGLSFAY